AKVWPLGAPARRPLKAAGSPVSCNSKPSAARRASYSDRVCSGEMPSQVSCRSVRNRPFRPGSSSIASAGRNGVLVMITNIVSNISSSGAGIERDRLDVGGRCANFIAERSVRFGNAPRKRDDEPDQGNNLQRNCDRHQQQTAKGCTQVLSLHTFVALLQ